MSVSRFRHLLPALTLCTAALAAAPVVADIYASAVTHAGRPAADLKRDQLDHPAEVLRLAGIRPGMQVADYLAGDGYYSELLSYIVGPRGHVYLLNNDAYEKWSDNQWQVRLVGNRLPNIEHRTVDAKFHSGRGGQRGLQQSPRSHRLQLQLWSSEPGILWPRRHRA